MEIEIKKPRKADAKTLKIHCKIVDRFQASLVDVRGEVIHEQEDGYVPGFMPGNHYGDYLILDIDLETGVIKNWVKPSREQLEEWIGEGR